MSLINRFFLVKEIISQAGEVHFRRWRLIQTPLFAVYIHKIARSDEEKDPHSHPWKFASLILSNGYTEQLWEMGNPIIGDFNLRTVVRYPGTVAYRPTTTFHKITLLDPLRSTWTLVVTGPRNHDLWGYSTDNGWVDHISYRDDKQRNQARLRERLAPGDPLDD